MRRTYNAKNCYIYEKSSEKLYVKSNKYEESIARLKPV